MPISLEAPFLRAKYQQTGIIITPVFILAFDIVTKNIHSLEGIMLLQNQVSFPILMNELLIFCYILDILIDDFSGSAYHEGI